MNAEIGDYFTSKSETKFTIKTITPDGLIGGTMDNNGDVKACFTKEEIESFGWTFHKNTISSWRDEI